MIHQLYEPFKKWSEKGSVWLLGDPHFGDKDCKFINPNWITPEEQVKRINLYCFKNDTFICLGDVGNAEYVKKLRAGHKVLIMGNHDKKKNYMNVFDEIYEGPLFISPKILLSHEPIYSTCDENFCINLHGHEHNAFNNDIYYMRSKKGNINLAANIINYTPVNLGILIKKGLVSKIKDIHRQTINLAKR